MAISKETWVPLNQTSIGQQIPTRLWSVTMIKDRLLDWKKSFVSNLIVEDYIRKNAKNLPKSVIDLWEQRKQWDFLDVISYKKSPIKKVAARTDMQIKEILKNSEWNIQKKIRSDLEVIVNELWLQSLFDKKAISISSILQALNETVDNQSTLKTLSVQVIKAWIWIVEKYKFDDEMFFNNIEDDRSFDKHEEWIDKDFDKDFDRSEIPLVVEEDLWDGWSWDNKQWVVSTKDGKKIVRVFEMEIEEIQNVEDNLITDNC